MLRLLPRADIALHCADALATSANAGLAGNANPNFWRFAGRKNADGALHRAAGPALLRACSALAADASGARCRIGKAVVTPAFDLHAGVVIHAVAPDGEYAVGLQQWWGKQSWSGGGDAHGGDAASRGVYLEKACPAGEADALLAETYASILEAADSHGVSSLALPAIGCGVLGFHPSRAAAVALRTFAEFARRERGGAASLERIDVAFPSDNVFKAWSEEAAKLVGPPQVVDVRGAGTSTSTGSGPHSAVGHDLRRAAAG